MVTLPLADCSRMLGIHPKTLHHWLKQANVPFVAHPTDARIKSLTLEHVEQLARLHRRPLQSLASAAPALPEATPVLSVFEGQATSSQESEAAHLQAPPAVPTSFPQQADLIQKLSCLETKVATLEEHLTQLALALLQEREHALERRLTALETAMHERVGRPLCPPPLPDREVTLPDKERAVAPQIVRQPGPAEQRARSRMPPLIEYSPAGSYVIISAQEGQLHLVPDSREWFEWLATLSSFRFVGKPRRFTAYRESDRRGPTRGWTAHRSHHHRRDIHWLGVTDRLSIACLEQMAATLQSHIDSL